MSNITLQDLFEITNTDDFLDINIYIQVVYFYLAIRADEFGIVENYKTLMRMIGISEGELELLILKEYTKIKDKKVYLMNRNMCLFCCLISAVYCE